jgi:signal peptidase I
MASLKRVFTTATTSATEAAATATAPPSKRAMQVWATTALASLPLVVWFRESVFSLARIHGTSMEPSLHDGDVILIRKSDRGVFVESLVRLIRQGEAGAEAGSSTSAEAAAKSEKAKLLRSEVHRGLLQYAPIAKFYERPPAALTGHVVVYKSPLAAFPNQLAVKRVIGLGGQYVRRSAGGTSSRHHHGRATQHHPVTRIVSVPDYSLYVEGDNKANSVDSRNSTHGAVSKNLLVGVAEYVLWPPSRWQRIKRVPEKDANGKPRAYWL